MEWLGHRLHLDAALLPLALPRRRLRHQRLLQRAPRLREHRRPGGVPGGRPPPRHPGHRRPRHEPHQRRAPLVRRVALVAGQRQGRLVRLERRRPEVARRPRRVHRRRAVQLDVGRHAPAVLLAPLLPPPARPQLRQPRSRRHHDRPGALLARPRVRRVPARRRALPVPARRDVGRAPARDARVHQAHPQADRRRLPGPHPAGRGQRLAERRRRLLRRRRRVPPVLPLPPHAAPLHGGPPGAALPDHRDPGPDPGHRRRLPVGHLPAQPRRADARAGERRGARLPHRRVRQGPADEAPHGDRAAPGPAARQRPAHGRAAVCPDPVAARQPGHLLRRRAPHG